MTKERLSFRPFCYFLGHTIATLSYVWNRVAFEGLGSDASMSNHDLGEWSATFKANERSAKNPSEQEPVILEATLYYGGYDIKNIVQTIRFVSKDSISQCGENYLILGNDLINKWVTLLMDEVLEPNEGHENI